MKKTVLLFLLLVFIMGIFTTKAWVSSEDDMTKNEVTH